MVSNLGCSRPGISNIPPPNARTMHSPTTLGAPHGWSCVASVTDFCAANAMPMWHSVVPKGVLRPSCVVSLFLASGCLRTASSNSLLLNAGLGRSSLGLGPPLGWCVRVIVIFSGTRSQCAPEQLFLGVASSSRTCVMTLVGYRRYRSIARTPHSRCLMYALYHRSQALLPLIGSCAATLVGCNTLEGSARLAPLYQGTGSCTGGASVLVPAS